MKKKSSKTNVKLWKFKKVLDMSRFNSYCECLAYIPFSEVIGGALLCLLLLWISNSQENLDFGIYSLSFHYIHIFICNIHEFSLCESEFWFGNICLKVVQFFGFFLTRKVIDVFGSVIGSWQSHFPELG